MDPMAATVATGIGATALMDLWSLARRRLHHRDDADGRHRDDPEDHEAGVVRAGRLGCCGGRGLTGNGRLAPGAAGRALTAPAEAR